MNAEKGAITKEAVSLMRRAAEITGNEEIKFAAAHIQSEYDKQHPRQQIQSTGTTKGPGPRYDNPLKKELPRSISAPDARFQPRPPPTYQQHQFIRRTENRTDNARSAGPLTLQAQLPRKRWTPIEEDKSSGPFYRPPHARPPVHHPLQSSASQNSTSLILTKEDAARLQSLADRTKDPEIKDLSRKVQHLFISGAMSESSFLPPVKEAAPAVSAPAAAVELAKPSEVITDAQGSRTEINQPLVKIESQADLPAAVNLSAGVSSN